MQYNLYEWQKKSFQKIKNKDAILSSPTGSGKSIIAYLWAGILKDNGEINKNINNKIIFTAPIKALSNERYLSLKKMGLDVGLETGDFKKNSKAKIICCTQEIYTLKYCKKKDLKVIIDEFHYIFREKERSRSYIEGVKNTHVSSKILIMSATFGNISSLKEYLDEISLRYFTSYSNEERATNLIFLKKGIRPENVKNAIVFVFSKKGVVGIADLISKKRNFSQSEKNINLIKNIAKILNIKSPDPSLFKGVGKYYGAMLPKEKLLTEFCYRARLIDVVVGTDALALGVNLPAEYVIFAQLYKFKDGVLSKNEFLQIAGRAGRKGFFDTGYVSFLQYDGKYEKGGEQTYKLYKNIINKDCESAKINLIPKYGDIVCESLTAKEEAKFLSSVSLPKKDYYDIELQISKEVKEIEKLISKKTNNNKFSKKKIKDIISWSWDNSLNFKNNINLAHLFLLDTYVDAFDIVDIFMKEEKNYLTSLLRAKGFIKIMEIEDIILNYKNIDNEIFSIDETIFTFEEKISQINDVLSNNNVL